MDYAYFIDKTADSIGVFAVSWEVYTRKIYPVFASSCLNKEAFSTLFSIEYNEARVIFNSGFITKDEIVPRALSGMEKYIR